MTIENCSKCGGTHYGSHECPYIFAPCTICGEETMMACADCAINSGGKASVHVCIKAACREVHETQAHPESDESGIFAGAGSGSLQAPGSAGISPAGPKAHE